MKLATIGCALGRHRLDRGNVRKVQGTHVGRCRNCRTPMEEVMPHVWEIQRVRDAGLGRRYFL